MRSSARWRSASSRQRSPRTRAACGRPTRSTRRSSGSIRSSQLVVHTVDVGLAPTSLVVADGSVWVANSGGRTVSRINAEAGRVVDTIDVGTSPSAIAANADGIWVTNRGDGTLVRLDPSTGELEETFTVGLAPSGLAVDEANVWVISEEAGTLMHLDPATAAQPGPSRSVRDPSRWLSVLARCGSPAPRMGRSRAWMARHSGSRASSRSAARCPPSSSPVTRSGSQPSTV